MIKEEKIINLTDFGNNNPVRARRILPYGERESGYIDEDGFITQVDGVATRAIPGIGSTSPENKP